MANVALLAAVYQKRAVWDDGVPSFIGTACASVGAGTERCQLPLS